MTFYLARFNQNDNYNSILYNKEILDFTGIVYVSQMIGFLSCTF